MKSVIQQALENLNNIQAYESDRMSTGGNEVLTATIILLTANAERIEACLHAFEGIHTDAIKRSTTTARGKGST